MRRLRMGLYPFLTFRIGLLLLLLGISGVFFHLRSEVFLTPDNQFEVARHLVEVGLVSLPMTLIIITRGIDLSVGSIVGLSAVAMGFSYQGGLPFGVALALGWGVGVLCGFLNGWFVAWVRVPPLLVTLASMAIYRGFALAISGGNAAGDFPPWFAPLGQGMLGPVPVQVLIFGVMVLLCWFLLSRTPWGRAIYAVGFNERASRCSGIPTRRILLSVYLLSGWFSGLAGLIYSARMNSARADAGTGFELEAITAVLLGGTSISGGEGHLLGTVIGLFLTSFLRNGLTLLRVPGEQQMVVLGLMLIGAVGLDRIGGLYWQKQVLRRTENHRMDQG